MIKAVYKMDTNPKEPVFYCVFVEQDKIKDNVFEGLNEGLVWGIWRRNQEKAIQDHIIYGHEIFTANKGGKYQYLHMHAYDFLYYTYNTDPPKREDFL